MDMPYSFDRRLVLRTPRWPFAADISETHIHALLQDAAFLEAIYLASPVLYSECMKWRSGADVGKKDKEKLVVTLCKYYTRMNSRCTPFGLFSGCSVGRWEEGRTKVVLDSTISRHTRLDMHYLCALSQQLAAKPGIREYLRYLPNNSIYEIGDEMRYVEYQYVNGKRLHQISSVSSSDYLKRILAAAADGVTLGQITAMLLTEDVLQEEADAFADEIIGAQLLVNELEPAITGKEFLFQVIERLRHIQKTGSAGTLELGETIALLETVNELLQKKDEDGSSGIEQYKRIILLLDKMGVAYDESKLFQTDLIKNATENTVDEALQQGLKDALTVLNRLTPAQGNENIRSFIRRFADRYDDKEMPLLTVMDTETGIGYLENKGNNISSLVDDVYIAGKEGIQKLGWGKAEQFLHKKLGNTSPADRFTISITDEEISGLPVNWDDLPASMSVLFRIVRDDAMAYIESVGGSSGANLLGRFAHADEKICEMVRDVTALEQENEPDAVYAEIIHLPESRIGNILLHPVFREYEIPYLAKSSLDRDHQIDVSDLYVSVRNNKIVLRSKRLNKQIIPRLSTAHNYSYNALPVYQFLCDLQLQGKRQGFYFYWGALEELHTFLPRVTYKNTILHLARWNFTEQEIKPLTATGGEPGETDLAAFRSKWNLPRLFVLAEGDNELLVDLDNPLLVRVWLDTVKGKKSFVLKEFILDQRLVTDEAGNPFVNQFVSIITRDIKAPVADQTGAAPRAAAPQTAAALRITDTPRTAEVTEQFALGSEWIYYKLYCGVRSADKILLDAIKPLVKELTQNGLTDKWFFIRYNDPDFHLRLRFHLTDIQNLGSVLHLLYDTLQPYLKAGYIWKLQADTYTRELNRYGRKTIDIAEAFFCNDSNALLSMLENTWGDGREEIRWLWSLRSADELLNSFRFPTADKLFLFVQLRDGLGAEFNMDKIVRMQLSDKYRMHKKKIELIMDSGKDLHHDMYPLIGILKEKAEYVLPLADTLNHLHNTGRLEMSLLSLVSSFIHMMFNRILTSSPRLHELVLYDFLCRYYQSVMAREKQRVFPSNLSYVQ